MEKEILEVHEKVNEQREKYVKAENTYCHKKVYAKNMFSAMVELKAIVDNMVDLMCNHDIEGFHFELFYGTEAPDVAWIFHTLPKKAGGSKKQGGERDEKEGNDHRDIEECRETDK